MQIPLAIVTFKGCKLLSLTTANYVGCTLQPVAGLIHVKYKISSNIGKHFSQEEPTSNKFEPILESSSLSTKAGTLPDYVFTEERCCIYIYTIYCIYLHLACYRCLEKNLLHGIRGDNPGQQVRYFCFTNLKKPETAMNFHISGYTIKITNMNTTIYGTICLPNLQVL